MILKNDHICFLFTKKYPFGKQEAYIHYEIDYLARAFEHVYVIPIEEFDYVSPRIIAFDNVTVFEINKKIQNTSVWNKPIDLVKNHILLFRCSLSSREKLKSLTTHFLYARRLIHMRAQSKALKNLFNQISTNKNVVCYHYWMHNSIVVQYLSQVRPAKTVSRAHALDLYHGDWPSYNSKSFLQFERLKIKYCNYIYSISEHGMNHFNRHFKDFQSKFKISRLGIFDKNPEFNPKQSKDLKLIVTCSSLVERKQLFKLPEILKHTKSHIKWVHIGGNESAESKHLQSLCSRYNINFEFKGQMNSNEIMEYYSHNYIALFCNLSYAEGIPVSLMEAAMFGIPMLATDTFGNPEIVNEDNGILIPVNFDDKVVASKIDALLENSDLWLQKSLSARKMYLTHYDAEKNFSGFIRSILD